MAGGVVAGADITGAGIAGAGMGCGAIVIVGTDNEGWAGADMVVVGAVNAGAW